ncbi:MAG: CBS domain-containing protein [Deltaproteobacteria bacterium]|nr:CBS domain-containing protein [Desulfobacterales bacterium]MDL1981233.1 CBS domain-containing protein [Deltaproteobacteria bacterium]MDL1988845.1 CBS domain-containing protein [Deltaproteobacteria bacterium]
MKAQEFMTTKIEFVDADRSVYDAVEKMVDRRIRSLLVRFSGKDLNHGIITARDIVFKVLAKGLNPKDIKVSEIASKPAVCIDKNANINEVASLMEKKKIARILVCEDEEIIGLIALLDLMEGALIMRARGEHDF